IRSCSGGRRERRPADVPQYGHPAVPKGSRNDECRNRNVSQEILVGGPGGRADCSRADRRDPGALPRSAPGVSQTQTGIGNVAHNGTGNVNITNTDLSTKLYVTNISVIAGEYQKYQGQPLDEGLKREIDQAIAQASAGKSSESIRRFEEIVRKAPLPAIYNN